MTLPAEIRDLPRWAVDGDRTDPEDVGLDRGDGWDLIYEQVGGRAPERRVWNQLLHEITTVVVAIRDQGLPLPWDPGIDYRHPAFVRGENGVIYVSLAASGPATGDSVSPDQPGQNTWRPH